KQPWITSLGVDYFLGIDGLGLLMVTLSAVVIPFAIVATTRPEQSKLYFALLLFLQSGLFGTFTALNFFHWFIFWELSLVPAFFLIKLWGGPESRAAALQFFIYTMVGSIAMLLAFVGLFIATDTFDFVRLAELSRSGELTQLATTKLSGVGLSSDSVMMLLFAGVFLGFAVKVPLIPFHTWLPLAYAEAPTTTSMVLTGVMSKMGVYGFIRVLLPIFPEQMREVLTPLLWLAVATIIFSAYAAFVQKDLKRIVAYSSINHLGYCLLGLFAVLQSGDDVALLNERAAALNGVVLQMFNHGITASALFCFVGFLEHRNAGARGLDDFGGMRKVAPVLCGLMGITMFSSLGLPGLNGFVGEFLIFKGAFSLSAWATALATIGLLATAIFLLTVIQKVFTGPVKTNHTWVDLTVAERLTVAPMVAAMFVLGLAPHLLLQVVNPTVMQMLAAVKF
ncbi:MAG TPA: NADH-quinone oxidoreductase subunit M, partial [Methylomirabilota bacterium]|nr:NADH-quinone oxidoreductase subunit M [Methylomirabilota bacterium]